MDDFKGAGQDARAALKARLEAATRERESLDRERAQREEEAELERKVEEAERSLVEERKFEELVAKYGDGQIGRVKTDQGAIILRRPTSLRYKRFHDKDDYSFDSCESFVRACVEYPSHAQYDEIVAALPLVVPQCMNRIARLCGLKKEETEGKS